MLIKFAVVWEYHQRYQEVEGGVYVDQNTLVLEHFQGKTLFEILAATQ